MLNVGVLGGGQLAQMLALAGIPLGFRFRFWDPQLGACAAVLGEHFQAPFDLARVEEFAAGLDLVTYEFEGVHWALAEALAIKLPVCPSPASLAVTQERLAEKLLLRRLNIPTARFAAVDSQGDFSEVAAQVGFPCVLKTRRQGYDGKGQRVVKCSNDLRKAWRELGGVPLLAEAWVAVEREFSLIAVRGQNGAIQYYPLTENQHVNGILRQSRAPLDSTWEGSARQYAARVLVELDYVGVLAIEFFEQADCLLANELSPRVHNSGHWTLEGAATSQFENHLRAIAGLPLGPSHALGRVAMLNLVGHLPAGLTTLAGIPYARLHLYGKTPAPGRKLGHLTLTGKNADLQAAELRRAWECE